MHHRQYLRAGEERLELIDIVRGIALFGVLVVNLVTEFRVSLFRQFLPPTPGASGLDNWVEAAIRYGLEMKAFAVFSFLFGLGLALQFERLGSSGRPYYWLTRRLLVLLVFGLVHLLLIWNGDILTEYALAGLLVLPMLAAPIWGLALASAALFAVYLVIAVVPVGIPWPELGWLQQHVVLAEHVYGSGSMADIVRFGMSELPFLLPLHLYVLPRTLALFLLGMLAWRTGVMQQPSQYRRLWIALAIGGVSVGGLLAVLDLAAGVGNTLLATGYTASIVVLAQWLPARRWLRGFAPVGRMAFSNYIAQSLLFGAIFFGVGLGQSGRLSAAPVLALGVAVYGVQMALSACWLRHYRYGPLEWLWRTLMYGEQQTMRRARSIGALNR